MGMRVRLNSSFDCTQLLRVARVVCVALQTYGGIFADNGGAWYWSGEGRARGRESGQMRCLARWPLRLWWKVAPRARGHRLWWCRVVCCAN